MPTPTKWIIIALVFILLFSAAGLTALSTQQHVRIGFLGSLTGKFAALGTSGRNGALLAIEERNRAGRVLDNPIDLIIADDAGSPEQAVAAVKHFAQENISCFIGPFTTASATALIPALNENGILAISPSAAGANLAGIDDLFIKLFPSTRLFGTALAQDMHKQGYQEIVVIWDQANQVFANTMIQGLQDDTHGFVLHVNECPFSSHDQPMIKSIVSQAIEQRADAILLIASAIDTAECCQRIRQLDTDIPLYSSPWGIANELIENGGRTIEGLRFFIPYKPNDTSASWQSFATHYRHRFNEEPTHVSLLNYEAATLLLDSINAADSMDPKRVKQYILSHPTRTGIQGNYSINATGDAAWPIHLHTIRNAHIVSIP